MSNEQIKRYTVGEEIFNSVTHGVGSLLSIAALVVMVVYSAIIGDGLALASSIVFGISLIILYTMSTLYHAISAPRAKEVLRVFDHTSIFLLIAGTYTPMCLISLAGNTKGLIVVVVVWACAILGIILNAIKLNDKTEKLSMVLYVAMGWAILVVFKDIIHSLPTMAFWLLVAGGVSYTGGIVFYKIKAKYMHSIWHIFVLMGSVLHFLCIMLYVLPMRA